ncbi:hypothetical protein [Paenarthrobacter sp. YJN-5]|uniref:hypothetical protein n=1 Tax=Paenarthrobacter sp. YJN-5 TaxID=2735316 RepID=UPI001877E386|nr:hypothetical protein [Paenarthrobacter sp. YJN-5]QOT19726.1 hypothetical protein HMI59_23995 [Paenarthrobacter sp. YJN-5]
MSADSTTTANAGDNSNTNTNAQQQQEQQQSTTFEAITSQEALDRVLAQRLAREKSKYADYADLKAKAQKYDDAEEQNKTDLQKANDRAEKAERRVQELEGQENRRTLAEEVARDKRVPVHLLRGDTKEQLEAHADEILAFRGPQGVVNKSGTNGDDKEKATSSVAAGRERFAERHKKPNS